MSVFKLVAATAFCLLGLQTTYVSAQNEAADTLPRVIILGEHEAAFEQMQLLYDQQLMEACQNDFNKAYDAWVDMLTDMEAYANEIKFSLNGVKMWINVFWDKDGSIKHIAYYLKPNSRNIKPEELAAFFNSFSNRYKLSVTSSKKFSHNGSAAFPMLPQQVSDKGNE